MNWYQFFILILAILGGSCANTAACSGVTNAECSAQDGTGTCGCATGSTATGLSCTGNNSEVQ